jgi:hypothetical protein
MSPDGRPTDAAVGYGRAMDQRQRLRRPFNELLEPSPVGVGLSGLDFSLKGARPWWTCVQKLWT